ncbi:MAG: M20 family peptidase [Mesorhizobium sp.]|uniref:M20 family metallopeptidase n=1 Tax=Mesorhizobium sp. TaxID=1871066 RepID=UPI000FE74AC8|nr:M20 family metallopeptidase [Mesorhizobium sp.]RWE19137.1 MAG: M20 family peptidase [Mesorhizobium sp.]
MSNVSDLLAQLVRIESINPNLSPAGSGEGAMAAYVAKICQDEGIEFEIQPVSKGRNNIFAWVRGVNPDKRVLFESHLDTVPAEGWQRDPFAAEIEGRRMYGRGTCDTKSSLAAMLHALIAVKKDKARATIFVAGTVDEEYQKSGARALAKSGLKFEAAVAGEPTNLEVVVAHKGSVRWWIETTGRAAHSSKPELGLNAIAGIAQVIPELVHLGDELRRRDPHPLVGTPSLTISLIQGGSDICTVPASCQIFLDRRLVPKETPAGAIEEVEKILADLREKHRDLKVRSVLPAVEDPPLEDATGSRIAEVAADACRSIAGTGATLHGAPWGTDASQIQLTGAKCVVLGPGDIAQAHTIDEYVDLDEVEKASEIYLRMMQTY